MLNLLPTEYVKTIRREYLSRLALLGIGLATVAFLLGNVALVPAFVTLHTEKVRSDKTITETNALINLPEEEKLLSAETNLKRELAFLHSSYEGLLDDIEAILQLKNAGISLSSVIIKKEGDGNMIKIAGIAETRGDLSAFQKNIENSGRQSGVKIPLSVFAKEKNLDFSISLMFFPKKE